jgi:hypothetical protein
VKLTSPCKFIVDNKLPISIVLPNVDEPILIVVAEFPIFSVDPVNVFILLVLIVPPFISPDVDISPKAVMVPPVVEILPPVVKLPALIAFAFNYAPPTVVILEAIE